MKYGMSPKDFDLLTALVIQPLKAAGAEIYLFGSRARGTHEKYSDVDILVSAHHDITNTISAAIDQIEASNFPFKVDLVRDRDLAPSYKPSVDRDKILL